MLNGTKHHEKTIKNQLKINARITVRKNDAKRSQNESKENQNGAQKAPPIELWRRLDPKIAKL